MAFMKLGVRAPLVCGSFSKPWTLLEVYPCAYRFLSSMHEISGSTFSTARKRKGKDQPNNREKQQCRSQIFPYFLFNEARPQQSVNLGCIKAWGGRKKGPLLCAIRVLGSHTHPLCPAAQLLVILTSIIHWALTWTSGLYKVV